MGLKSLSGGCSYWHRIGIFSALELFGVAHGLDLEDERRKQLLDTLLER